MRSRRTSAAKPHEPRRAPFRFLWEVLVDIRGGDVPDGFEERILPLLLRATAGTVSADPLDRAAVGRFDAEPFMHLHTVAEERERRGFWTPQGASG